MNRIGLRDVLVALVLAAAISAITVVSAFAGDEPAVQASAPSNDVARGSHGNDCDATSTPTPTNTPTQHARRTPRHANTAHQHPDQHPDEHCNRHAHEHGNPDLHGDSDQHTNPDFHADTPTNTPTNTPTPTRHANADQHADPDRHAHADQHADADRHADSDRTRPLPPRRRTAPARATTSSSKKASGEGKICTLGGKASFHFEVKRKSGGSVKGKLGVPRQDGRHQGEERHYPDARPSRATWPTFSGTCKKTATRAPSGDGDDNGKPGTNDRFQLSGSGGPSVDQNLISGNIKVKS